MHEAKGHHSGDHAGSKHWIDKKIVDGNCDNCGPVMVETFFPKIYYDFLT